MTAPTLALAIPSSAGPSTGVRLLPAPPVAPPYDDEQWEVEAGTDPSGRYFAETLPGAHRRARGHPRALALPFPAPSTTVPRVRLAAQGPTTVELVPPAAWSARFLRVLLEAMAGLRPVSQLGSWANSDVCRLLARRVRTADQCRDLRRSMGSVRSLHVSTPAVDVAEVCAVVHIGNRVRAVALRVEATDRAWRCTDLQMG
ncbi:MAG: Rv3235 family protein [Frankiaceae bacterium]